MFHSQCGVAAVVSAACYALIGKYQVKGLALGCRNPNNVVRFVQFELSAMAEPFRSGVRVALCCLSFLQLFRGGATFVAAPPEQRRVILGRWKRSRIGPVKDLVRLLESMTVLALYDPHTDDLIETHLSPR